MAYSCGYPEFKAGDRAVSLAIHPPSIKSGTEVEIVLPYIGMLYAVRLPDGQLHRWLAWFELQSENANPYCYGYYQVGESVKIINAQGHHHINKGMEVRIAKAIYTPFYDLRLPDGSYHRWLADFELARPAAAPERSRSRR